MKIKRLFLILFFLPWMGRFPVRDADFATPGEPEKIAAEALLPRWASAAQEGPSPPAGVLAPDLVRALDQAAEDSLLRVIVEMDEQVEPARVMRGYDARDAGRRSLVRALQSTAERSQAPLRAYLTGAQKAGLVAEHTPFWVLNAIALRAQPDVIRRVAAYEAVAQVRLDVYRQWVTEGSVPEGDARAPDAPTEVEWGISRIRADQVWSTLHISGTGVVVAGMDTGVDWLHPALQANYRGYHPHGPAMHVGNWFDAVNGSVYPFDDHSHGTHTIGTAVGGEGIGVAPGARWIGVKVLNSGGYAYDSWLHAGFEWLLAPGGDPARAPDVVNCSWGSDNGYLTTFQADLRALRAAGIVPVFSNGNSGPYEGTVGSPASLPEAFAVGAVDTYDHVASFSSRGPSPWKEVRPHVAAPGVNVRSSMPGGVYGTKRGTSMAAPHVAGVVALLRSVSPTLSVTRTMAVITGTAVPLGASIPNNDTGWGRVDALAAVASLASPGYLTGTVTWAADGTPIAGATVSAVPHAGGGGGSVATQGDGTYAIALAPALYDVTASAFGFVSQTAWGVPLVAHETTREDFSLDVLPSGVLRGHVTDAATGQPLTATVTVLDTPREAQTHTYEFLLPEGQYTVRARQLGYRVITATAVVTAGEYTMADLALPPSPSILLVDSGAWYYDSEIEYYRQALDDLSYAYDEWAIRGLPDDVPSASDLAAYDIVIWSAPWDAPGYIGAQDAIIGYLSAGGKLFLSGQDIGYLDGGGWEYFPYYVQYLKARLVRDNANTWQLTGAPDELFAGVVLTITGAGGAQNQVYPDEISVLDEDSAAEVLFYLDDGCGGMRASTCLGYRVVYLSFGFEGINARSARRDVMTRTLSWLTQPPPALGIELTPETHTAIGEPGTVVTHAVRVRHVGEGGVTDTITLTLSGGAWAAQLSVPSLTLTPCMSQSIAISVSVPASAPWDARDAVTLTARSSISPTLSDAAVLTTKAPAPILLVDDDRFYEQREKYEAALNTAGLAYDFWQTCPATGWCRDASPTLDDLRRYPIVVWWTGYDWYRPVTTDERVALEQYLQQGGRLFLSSQDFLYYHADTPLSRDGLGVLDFTESVTPSLAYGAPEDPIGAMLGPYPLDYPFQNWSDSVLPTPGAAVAFRDQNRHAVALARRGENYATSFFAFPFEVLPELVRPQVMERAVGWLSWLGDSHLTASRGAVEPGGTLTYTLRLHNDGPVSITASVSNTLPTQLSMISGSLTGPASYSPTGRLISWQGELAPGAALTATYGVTVSHSLGAGDLVLNAARLTLADHAIAFERSAPVRVGRPDLRLSAFVPRLGAERSGAVFTPTVSLLNAGVGDAPTATVTISLPQTANLASGSFRWTGSAPTATAEVLTHGLRWRGPLSVGGAVTLTYGLTLPDALDRPILYSVAFLEDGFEGAWERPQWMTVEPWRVWLPVTYRQE